MTSMQLIKGLVLFAFILNVTSHPTSYGSRLINFLDGGGGGSSGADRSISNNGIESRRFGSGSGSGNYDEEDRRHHQKNFETGSDSSSAEISFQPLRELESVSAGKQFLVDDSPLPLAARTTNLLAAAASHNKRNFHRRLRSPHRSAMEGNQHHRQRYPDESLSEGPILSFSSSPAVNDLNEISQPEGDEEAAYEFMQRDLQGKTAGSGESLLEDEPVMEDNPWSIYKRQQHPFSFGSAEGQQLLSSLVDDSNNKRNALVAFKRQKLKSHQTQFIPSISVGAMTNLGDFFKNLRNNVDFMEKGRFSGTEEHLLEGDHPLRMLKEELASASDGEKPTGTAAFLHAIRTYRPSQRIRSLVSLNPEGYHGSQFLDPNYMWVGLGKRK